MTNPQYASLSAVKNHHVYAVNADIISRARGLRMRLKRLPGLSVLWKRSRLPHFPQALRKLPGFTPIPALLALLIIIARSGD